MTKEMLVDETEGVSLERPACVYMIVLHQGSPTWLRIWQISNCKKI